jgi:hypothetical protein
VRIPDFQTREGFPANETPAAQECFTIVTNFQPEETKKIGSGVADGIRTRNNKLHKLGLYH